MILEIDLVIEILAIWWIRRIGYKFTTRLFFSENNIWHRRSMIAWISFQMFFRWFVLFKQHIFCLWHSLYGVKNALHFSPLQNDMKGKQWKKDLRDPKIFDWKSFFIVNSIPWFICLFLKSVWKIYLKADYGNELPLLEPFVIYLLYLAKVLLQFHRDLRIISIFIEMIALCRRLIWPFTSDKLNILMILVKRFAEKEWGTVHCTV